MSAIANDRYLIATGPKIEPRIFRSQAEAESAAETLAYRVRHDIGVYRLSDAGLSSIVRAVDTREGTETFEISLVPSIEAFRPDGSSWLDAPAEAKP